MKIIINSKDIKIIKEYIIKSNFIIKYNIPFSINKCPQTNLRVLEFKYNINRGLLDKIKEIKILKEFLKPYIVNDFMIYLE
jgi:hypothetical protein